MVTNLNNNNNKNDKQNIKKIKQDMSLTTGIISRLAFNKTRKPQSSVDAKGQNDGIPVYTCKNVCFI